MINIKKTILIITLVLVSNVTAAELKIGYINFPAVLEASPQAKLATKTLLDKFTPRQKSIALDAERYHSLVTKLEKDSLILSTEQLAVTKSEILKLERKLKRDEQEFREELNVQKNSELKKTRDLILKAIHVYAEENAYDLILAEGALYASNKVNISAKILEVLNNKNNSKTEQVEK